MKKKILLLLTGLMVLSVVGCTARTQPTTPDESTVISTESSDVVTEEPPVEVTPEVVEDQDPVEEYSLKELFAQHGMKVGTCLTTQMIDKAETNSLILSQFNSITMENAMKPDYIFNKKESIAQNDLVIEFNKDAIKMLDWAKENDMAVRGHTMVWYSQTPEWIFHEGFDVGKDYVSRDVMLARMESLIKNVFAKLDELGYADLFYAYDVVNEAWNEDGTIRQNNWVKTIGSDYLWYAFYYADMYAPEHIDLYYNDYNEQYKAKDFVKFLNTLVDEEGNYLIDGVGLQAHLYTMDDMDTYFDAVDTLAETGLKLQLTELDVSLGAWQNTLQATDENLRDQGQYYYDLIHGLFERADSGEISMDALTFWGFSDGLSWRKEASPLLYDKKNEPKYAYYGAMQIKEKAGFEE